jgi:Nucleotidyl transferase AbiEii toxin, Type IV TA system
VLDLEQELGTIIDALAGERIEYALCGGLAMAVHGAPRATIDIDLLVREEDVDRIRQAVAPHGFTRALPMTFSKGHVRIERVTKIDPSDGETLMLDLLVVTPALETVWQTREKREWRGGVLTVVSRDGLIQLKTYRLSKQDQADIERLGSLE